MKSFFKLTLATILALTFSQQAFSGVLIEPYLGYRIMGDFDDSSSADISYNGAVYGARLGYQSLGFMGGLDYSLSSYDLKFEQGNTSAKLATDSSNLGIFVGYNAPILLRVWGTYFLSNKLEYKVNGTELSGSGFALGAGFTGLPFVSLNLEYRAITYDEAEGSGQTITLNPSRDAKEILFSVSLPLDF